MIVRSEGISLLEEIVEGMKYLKMYLTTALGSTPSTFCFGALVLLLLGPGCSKGTTALLLLVPGTGSLRLLLLAFGRETAGVWVAIVAVVARRLGGCSWVWKKVIKLINMNAFRHKLFHLWPDSRRQI